MRATRRVYLVGLLGLLLMAYADGGNILDHFTEDALQLHLGRFDSVLADHGSADVRAFFNDSHEVEGADWPPDFLGAFERQQGYDLRLRFPALTGSGSDEKSAWGQADYRESARVTLNRQDLGRVWAHPFTRRVQDALQPGENVLGINYQPFDASTWSPMPSGLLGPVSLIPGTAVQPGESL